MKTFKTIRAAAIAGCAEALPLTRRTGWEHAGVIYKIKGGFAYSAPATSKNDAHVDMGPIIQRLVPAFPAEGYPRWDTPRIQRMIREAGIVSDYHTHPCQSYPHGDEHYANYFSEGDMEGLISLGFKANYMAVSCTGKVYEATGTLQVVYPAGRLGDAAALGPVIATV